MRKLIIFILCIIISLDIIDTKFLNNMIYNFLKDSYFNKSFNIVINTDALNKNKYEYTEYSNLVKNTSDFYPKNRNDLLDIYYTALNNGLDDFSYYCDKTYKDCIQDITTLSNDSDTFTYINQLVHPYNSFNTINSNYNGFTKRIDINIEKKYSKEDIEKIENKMDEIINTLNINSYSSLTDKIKVFHDYLAATNKYDSDMENNKKSQYNSDTAIGTLFEGHSICSGYSDAMAIFLNKLNLNNVKIITKEHAWNAVEINNKWYHIDLTWDDPIVSNGMDIIQYDYFLISTDDLLKKDVSQHNFDRDLYDFIK